MRLNLSLASILIILICTITCKSPAVSRFPNGGYGYPSSISKADSTFYFVPLKNKLSKRDSILYAYAYLLYQGFDEPNLSLRYAGQDIIRLAYMGAFENSLIIKLTGNELIIKTVKAGRVFPVNDESDDRLTKLEKRHYYILRRDYPTGETQNTPRIQHYLDSMINIYPQLLDPAYYLYLIKKRIVPSDPPVVYITKTKTLSQEQYETFIDLLNKSGYWSLPYFVECSEPPNDGYGFTLEVNTKEKYNAVSTGVCEVINKSIGLKKAAQKLVAYAGLESKINLTPIEFADSANLK